MASVKITGVLNPKSLPNSNLSNSDWGCNIHSLPLRGVSGVLVTQKDTDFTE